MRSVWTTLRNPVLSLPTSAHSLLEWQRGSGLTPFAPYRTLPFLYAQMGYGPFCGLWMQRRGTDRWPCSPSLSNPSTSLWRACPDGSEWRDNEWLLKTCSECAALQCVRTRSHDEEENPEHVKSYTSKKLKATESLRYKGLATFSSGGETTNWSFLISVIQQVIRLCNGN